MSDKLTTKQLKSLIWQCGCMLVLSRKTGPDGLPVLHAFTCKDEHSGPLQKAVMKMIGTEATVDWTPKGFG